METLFFTLLFHSLKGGIVVGGILLLRFLFGRRIAPAVRHALWIFVIAALVLPTCFSIPVRVVSLDVPMQSEQLMEKSAPQTVATENPDTAIFLGPAEFQEPVSVLPVVTETATPVAWEPDSQNTFQAWTRDHVFALVFVTWGFGAALLLTFSIGQVLRLSRQMKSRERIDEETVLAVLAGARQKMKIKREITLYRSNRIATPLLKGLFKPAIFLPGDLCRKLSSAQLEHLFLHELAHLKRHDILIGWLLSLCCMIHWFNPLMWLMVRLAGIDSEEASDALALSRLSQGERIAYGRTLLEFVQLFHSVKVRKMPGFVGIFESPSKLSRRIEMIIQNKQCWKVGSLIVVGLCAILCTATLCRFEKIDAGEVTPGSNVMWIPPVPENEAEPHEFDVPMVHYDLYVLESVPGAGEEKLMTLVSQRITEAKEKTENFAFNKDLVYEIFKQLENEGKVKTTTHPVITAADRELAMVFVGDTKSNMLCGAVPEIVGNQIMTTLIWEKNHDLESQQSESVLNETFVSLQENVPLIVGGMKLQFDNDAEKEYLLCLNAKIVKPVEKAAEPQKQDEPLAGTSKENRSRSNEVDMNKLVDVRGKVVLPEGAELRGRTSIMVRALSADNKTNYFGSHTQVNDDGTFVYHAVCNLNYMMTVSDEFGEWASESVWLEIGNEAPEEEIVFQLVKGSVIEGTVLALETGSPLADTQLIFAQYFETQTKPEGAKRIALISGAMHTNSAGKFRKTVLPGEYGVTTLSEAMSLFSVYREFPENFFLDNWDENTKRDYTAFRVKENEIVRPILRLPEDSDDVKTPMPIHGRVLGPDGVIPEKLTVHVRALSSENGSNMYASGGSYSEDGKIVLMEPKNQNYMVTVYDPENVWAAKPVMLEVGKEMPKDEFTLNLEKGILIEGTLIDHETGRAVPNHEILFFEYFDVTVKRTGQPRTFPINSYGITDEQGMFRRTVLPGKYGVCVYPAADSLFIPEMIKKATVTDSADWQKHEERPATAFYVSDQEKIVKPVLRITSQK